LSFLGETLYADLLYIFPANFLSGNIVEEKMLFWGIFLYFYCEKPSLLLFPLLFLDTVLRLAFF
jgi:hypothetical protein